MAGTSGGPFLVCLWLLVGLLVRSQAQCDPSSSLANACYNANGSKYTCCSGTCGSPPGSEPYCEGQVPSTAGPVTTAAPGATTAAPGATTAAPGVTTAAPVTTTAPPSVTFPTFTSCDSHSLLPNTCYNNVGSLLTCCAGRCGSPPGPLPYCEGQAPVVPSTAGPVTTAAPGTTTAAPVSTTAPPSVTFPTFTSCDPSSLLPNTCYNNVGSLLTCCASSCGSPPGPLPYCEGQAPPITVNPSPSPSPSRSVGASLSASPSQSPSRSVGTSLIPSPSSSLSSSVVASLSPSPSPSPSRSVGASLSASPSSSPSRSVGASLSSSPSSSPSSSVVASLSPSPSSSPSPSPGSGTFCVVKPGANPTDVQTALNYACDPNQGNVDCTSIQTGGPCAGNLTFAASVVFNAYYLINKASGGTCDFLGTAHLTSVDPSTATCAFATPSSPLYCVAVLNADRTALQSAVDWTCNPLPNFGNADCSYIQQFAPCWVPWDLSSSLPTHASLAFNDFYQRHKTASGSAACHYLQNGNTGTPISTLSFNSPAATSNVACKSIVPSAPPPPLPVAAPNSVLPTANPPRAINFGGGSASWPLTPAQWVGVLQQQGYSRVKFYFVPDYFLRVLANTGLEVELGMTLNDMQYIANNEVPASTWVNINVKRWVDSGVRIVMINVGLEPFNYEWSTDYTGFIASAFTSTYQALAAAGLDTQVKLTVPLSIHFQSDSYGVLFANPLTSAPSQQTFAPNVKSVFAPILPIMAAQGSYMCANIHPYYPATSAQTPSIPLEFGLFQPPPPSGFQVSDGSLNYTDYASLVKDSFTAAVTAMGYPNLGFRVCETGWPDASSDHPALATPANRMSFFTGLFAWAAGNGKGSPDAPNAVTPITIFDIFDGEEKTGPDEAEHHWGLYNFDGTKKGDWPSGWP